MLIPFVNVVVAIVVTVDMAKAFGKDAGYALLLIFLPFIGYPMLAFGDAEYQGGAGGDVVNDTTGSWQAPTQ
jgi:hypothetical protein